MKNLERQHYYTAGKNWRGRARRERNGKGKGPGEGKKMRDKCWGTKGSRKKKCAQGTKRDRGLRKVMTRDNEELPNGSLNRGVRTSGGGGKGEPKETWDSSKKMLGSERSLTEKGGRMSPVKKKGGKYHREVEGRGSL